MHLNDFSLTPHGGLPRRIGKSLLHLARSVLRRGLSLSLGIAVVGAASVGCGGGGGSPGSGNASIVHLKTTTVAGGVDAGVPYAQTFEAEIPHPPGIFVVTGGSLPPGLALNNQSGEFTGYPRQTGAFHFEIGRATAPTRRSRRVATRTSPRTAGRSS